MISDLRNPVSLTRFFSQNSPSGLFVLRVSATDDDLGSNAKITYILEGTTLVFKYEYRLF